MLTERFDLEGHSCYRFTLGDGRGLPVIVPISEEEAQMVLPMAESLERDCNGTLVFFTVRDWFRDLSPWPGPPAFGKENFEGQGSETLSFVEDLLLPHIAAERVSLAGYSLGGLFALWAMLEKPWVKGCASCSGSLWYPCWEEYAKGREIPSDALLYLSLGTHEKRTRNPIMCRVGDATRNLYSRAQEERIASCLEWNPGGHFREPEARLEKGICWLLQHQMSL